MRLLMMVFALALAGCASPTAEEIAAADTAACAEMGFVEGTPEAAYCRLALLNQRSARLAAARANTGATIARSGLLMQEALSSGGTQRMQTYCYTAGATLNCY
jgi:hypothetical protein